MMLCRRRPIRGGCLLIDGELAAILMELIGAVLAFLAGVELPLRGCSGGLHLVGSGCAVSHPSDGYNAGDIDRTRTAHVSSHLVRKEQRFGRDWNSYRYLQP